MRLAHVPSSPVSTPLDKHERYECDTAQLTLSLHEALHDIHMSLLNPRHDQVVHRHLEAVHASGRRSVVLDVGTGSGSWAIGLARRQPFADVVGIDITWDRFEATRLAHGNADFHTVGESAV